MTPQAPDRSESDAVRRRMLAFAAVAGQLAAPADPDTLGSRLLGCLRDDVEALVLYLALDDGSFTLLLQAGCAATPPPHAVSARDICGIDPAELFLPGEPLRVFVPGSGRPAWGGARGTALAALPVGGAGPGAARGLALFVLAAAGQAPSLAALLELSARKAFEALVPAPPAATAQAPDAAGRIRVLLIDDEDLVVAHVKRILERAGFAFHAAPSAHAGLALAAAVHPDVILIDQVLPGLDGTGLLRLVRRDDLLSTVPVIMISGRAGETDRIAALGEGADDFVAKPFSNKELVARIEANVRLVKLRRDATWRQGELLRLRQSQQELRTLLDTVQRVRDDERRMLAREVHDQLGQILTVARVDIRLLQDRLAAPERPPSTGEIQAELRAALSGIDLAIAAVQDIAALLRPPELEEGGLVAALRWQAADMRRRARIDCVVRHDPAGYVEPPPFVAGELLRMCQEALTNVLRHAGARRVVVQVAMRNACLLVRVCDDGAGIPRASLRAPASLGLTGMRERAASIRASVHIYGRRGRGTMVAIRRRLAFW